MGVALASGGRALAAQAGGAWFDGPSLQLNRDNMVWGVVHYQNRQQRAQVLAVPPGRQLWNLAAGSDGVECCSVAAVCCRLDSPRAPEGWLVLASL
eukprot:586252-Prymnesium_polylepis.1